MREGFKILCFLIFHSGIKYDGKSLAPEILQNSKKNLERPPILAHKLGILRTGYIRAAKFQVFFGINIYLTGYVGA